MPGTTVIPASDAKARFSELLQRAQKGEDFAITLHGKSVAKLMPVEKNTREKIREAISRIKARRIVLNPHDKPKLTVKALREQGRK